MFEESVDSRQSLHRRVLIAAFILFVQGRSEKFSRHQTQLSFLVSPINHVSWFIYLNLDLSSRGAQAWTYRIGPNLRWLDAREWCQKNSTNMVVIQNQEETVFLNNLLPFNKKYYWLGIRKQGGEWIRDRTNETVPEEAQNWASNEPDDGVDQDCVEIYIKRAHDTDKWNNDNCRRKKGTICYTGKILFILFDCLMDGLLPTLVDLCEISLYVCRILYAVFLQCSCRLCGDHWELYLPVPSWFQRVALWRGYANIVEAYLTQPWPVICYVTIFVTIIFSSAIACEPLLDPEQGFHDCLTDPYGSNRFNSSYLFNCKLGFQLVGMPQLLCQASGHWNNPVPLCQGMAIVYQQGSK